jgi:rod shape-determining protein MreC
VYDKQVRRRRAVLALLVGLSLILITVWFGEAAGGPLRSVQRGVVEVISPVQEGASRALKPARDLAGWFGDTLDAKSERDRLQTEVQALRQQVVDKELALNENQQLRSALQYTTNTGVAARDRVSARVIFRSPTVWYSTITIDKGSSAGVHRNDPVVNGDGLVGKVTEVWTGGAQVTLLTDHTSAVSAKVSRSNAGGVVQTEIGSPTDLLLDYLNKTSEGDVVRGDRVVTAGTTSSRLESLFPAGIPIGRVRKVDAEELGTQQRVHVSPYADLRHLDFVIVLTNPDTGANGAQQAQAP